MTFFLLKCNNEYINNTLLHIPNGTPLTIAQLIYCSYDFCIYWFDAEYITNERIEKIKNMDEIEYFEEIQGITISIYDNNWQWNDTYIKKLFNLKN